MTKPVSRRARLLCGALLFVAGVTSAGAATAQSIQGTLVDGESGAPVPQAIVVVLAESGAQVTGTLSDEKGAFTVRLPLAGRYRLRAERIGYRSITSPPLNVGLEGISGYRMLVATEAVSLEGVTARSSRRCVLDPREGVELQRVWEEASKALTAAALTQRERWIRFDVRRHVRHLNAATLAVEQETSELLRGYAETPFRSVALERLEAHGFLEFWPDSITFHAPDADVLLSREFRDTHCFRLQPGTGELEGMIGLAFEPVRGRTVPEVTGVLWLDARSAELRHLEFRYTHLPWQVPTDRLGGRVEFRRLPNGAWFIERWWIRAPEIRAEARRVVLPGHGERQQRIERIERVREEGGTVHAVHALDGSRVVAAYAGVRGVVFDSIRSAPLPGARVFLSGTQYAAETDEAGRFELHEVPPGDFTVSFGHARLDSLGIGPPSRRVSLVTGEVAAVELSLPAMEGVIAQLCGQQDPRAPPAALVGYVRDAETGAALAGARVVVGWGGYRLSEAPGGRGHGDARGGGVVHIHRHDRTAEAVADASGRFRICDIPPETSVRAEAYFGRHSSGAFTLRLERGTLARYDLPVELHQ